MIAAILLPASAGAAEPASCERPAVILSGVNFEADRVCAAIGRVIRYFADHGMEIDLHVTVRFQREVHIETVHGLTNARHPLAVSGVFTPDRNEIQIVNSASAWTYRRRPWGLAWDQELADSILQHEIVHAVVSRLMGSRRGRLPSAWHEALAYGVQIDLMDESLRARVLAQYPAQEPFSNMLQVNDFVYGLDPDAFAVAAYRTYARDGKIGFLKKAIALEFDMLDVNELLP